MIRVFKLRSDFVVFYPGDRLGWHVMDQRYNLIFKNLTLDIEHDAEELI